MPMNVGPLSLSISISISIARETESDAHTVEATKASKVKAASRRGWLRGDAAGVGMILCVHVALDVCGCGVLLHHSPSSHVIWAAWIQGTVALYVVITGTRYMELVQKLVQSMWYWYKTVETGGAETLEQLADP
ncbi:hypothetical protein K504DRAFT_448836 [Pleomassaria siparia CBS 279.74]|uniref:Uncharacterized protein n=1 Tax=Pleomassaria siparia CBS 279.74 TaxID=1314801 RepID=A0A6G1JYC9_9PLEO|nr:hypothetical protein K504DRAFT_448836 [Pleomassaria siparia CBS 279.74]